MPAESQVGAHHPVRMGSIKVIPFVLRRVGLTVGRARPRVAPDSRHGAHSLLLLPLIFMRFAGTTRLQDIENKSGPHLEAGSRLVTSRFYDNLLFMILRQPFSAKQPVDMQSTSSELPP